MNKLTKFLVGALCALALVTSVTAADTGADTPNYNPSNEWVVSLGGVGSTATTGDVETALGFDVSVGLTGRLLLPLEGGVRQSVSWDTEDSAVFSTRAYADWTLVSLAKETLDVFVGANAGATYGDIQTVWTAAPEAGLRWWVKNDVSVLLRTEFPFRLNDGAEFTDRIVYFLGFQVRW